MNFLMNVSGTRCLSVLAYHRVLAERDPLLPGEPTVEEFAARMRWVAAHFNVLTLLEAVQALRENRLPKRALSITFDDGYADNYEHALPVLKRLGVPATFFIAAGFLDGGCMFNDVVIESMRQTKEPELLLDDLELGHHPLGSKEQRSRAIDRILQRLKYLDPERRSHATVQIERRAAVRVPTNLMMTSGQVKGLLAAGMTVGAHTLTHPILTQIPLSCAREEMAVGRARLEQICGTAVRLFAYPNGKPGRDYGPQHAALAEELGFEGAVSAAWGAARPGDDIFQIPRFTPWDRPNWRFGLRLTTKRLSPYYARA